MATLRIHPASPARERRRGRSPGLPALCVPRTKTVPGKAGQAPRPRLNKAVEVGGETAAGGFQTRARRLRCLGCGGGAASCRPRLVTGRTRTALPRAPAAAAAAGFPPQADGAGARGAPTRRIREVGLCVLYTVSAAASPCRSLDAIDRAGKGTEGTQRGS